MLSLERLKITIALLVASAMLTSTASAQETKTKPAKMELHPIAADVKKQMGKYRGAFTLAVTLKTKEGKGKEMVAAYKKAMAKTRKEEGNIQYTLNQSFSDKNEFFLYERWKTLSALDAHLKQPYLVAMLKELDPVLAEPPKLQAMKFRFNKKKGTKKTAK